MQYTRVLAGLLAFGATAMAADPSLLNLVMPGAKVLSDVNVLSAKSSPFGQFLITQIQAKDYAGLQKVIAATGFDPFTDVNEILAASVADSTHPSGLVAMIGNFKVDQVLAAIAGNPGVNAGAYNGSPLITFTTKNAKASPAIAFIGTSFAVAGDVATVKAAVDQSVNGSSNAIAPALATQVADLSASDDAWFLSSAPVSALLPANLGGATGLPGQAAQILSSIQSFSGGVKFGASTAITADLVANSPQNAAALGSVVQLVISMFSMNAGSTGVKNPQLAILLPLLQTAVVTASGNDLHLGLTVPESQLELLAGSHTGN